MVFDGDYPMAYGGIDLNRDLTLPLSEVRAQDETPDNVAFASLPELRRAGVELVNRKAITARMKVWSSELPRGVGRGGKFGGNQGWGVARGSRHRGMEGATTAVRSVERRK